ncbi:MAG: recombinase RecA [Planctomycetota bacterium]|nr:MAG: recombinase RecA [Planctomycetota bacterium]
MTRLPTGIAALDASLGGGLIPGSLVMLCGATGIGKTQLGLQMLAADCQAGDVPAAAIIDLSSRGDSQNHIEYARRLSGAELSVHDPRRDVDHLFDVRPPHILPFLGYRGRRVLRSQMDVDEWHAWQSELNRRMPQLYRFVYGHLLHGTRRFLIDGIEPQGSASDSLQMDLLELIYHRMLRQEHDWLAREVFRQHYSAMQSQVAEHAYDHQQSVAIVLVTTPHSMLDQLMADPLADGALAAGANTVILLGRQIVDGQMQRAMFIAKHRGSYADPRILPFAIDDSGVRFADQ